MSEWNLILWGIVIVSSVGLVCTIVKGVLDYRFYRLKMKLLEDEQLLRLRTQAAMFFDITEKNFNQIK
jgi:hypothetical protein